MSSNTPAAVNRHRAQATAVRNRTRATHCALLAACLAVWIGTPAVAAQPSPADALRQKFPAGIPWQVEFDDLAGQPLGTVQMRITAEHANSCLGGMDGGMRVEFTHTEKLAPQLRLSDYGVALFSGDRVKIDLTGGICDAYLLMEGALSADGASSGSLYTFGMRGGHDIGKFHAAVP